MGHSALEINNQVIHPSPTRNRSINLDSHAKIIEAPLEQFQLSWATELDKQWLSREMLKLGRQRMNLQVMPGARFILLKNTSSKVIGWAGLDHQYNLKYPEFFSLNLDSRYRHYSLGLLIESARASFFFEQKIKYAYVRMARDTSYRLLMKRLESKFYSELSPKELEPSYLNLCQRCELYQRHCQDQVFLKFDIETFIQQSIKEIGVLDMSQMPKRFHLKSLEEPADSDRRALRNFQPIWV